MKTTVPSGNPNTDVHAEHDFETRFDIAIVGGGLVGLTAALSFARATSNSASDHIKRDHPPSRIVLIAPTPETPDPRTTAMLMPTVEGLKTLGVWEAVAEKTAPLKTMRLIDATKRLVRAPVVDFRSTEIGLDAFGHNVPNADLADALREQIATFDCVEIVDDTVTEADPNEEGVSLTLSSGKTIHDFNTVKGGDLFSQGVCQVCVGH
ncbi:MAG: FAD-dependent monooxygenase, partial [Pseudomonadota bacterium]